MESLDHFFFRKIEAPGNEANLFFSKQAAPLQPILIRIRLVHARGLGKCYRKGFVGYNGKIGKVPENGNGNDVLRV